MQLNLIIPKQLQKLLGQFLKKKFVTGSKILLTLPFLVNNELVTDFSVKANLFNDFFRERCRSITNESSLPNNQTIETVARLSDLNIDTDTIIKIICSFDPNNPVGTRRCNNVGFRLFFGRDVKKRSHNVVATLLLRLKTNVVATLCFRRRISDLVLTLQQHRDFEVFFLTKI